MLQKKSKTKFSFISFILVFIMFGQVLCSFLPFNVKKLEKAMAEYLPTEITISNSNFENSSSTLPADPNSFTTEGTKGSTISGVIDIAQTKFETNATDKYELTFNPSKPESSEDDKILMINNQNIASSYGYVSSSFTLSKNGYYVISAYVYTQNEENITSTASLYLSNSKLNNLSTAKIENINTRGSWKNYKFYVKTSSSSDESVSLKLYIGTQDNFTSKGAVFFDNLKAYSLSEKDFYTSSSLNTNSTVVDLSNKDVTISNGLENTSFENGLTGYTKTTHNSLSDNFSKVIGIGDNFDESDSKLTENPTSANLSNNLKALLIYNKDADYVSYDTNEFLIEQYKYYKLSVFIKTSDFTSNGASLTLTQKNPFDSESFTPLTLLFKDINASSETNDVTNDWIEYSYYIQGNSFKDSKAVLSLSLGSQDGETTNKATGYVLFDNIKLEEITTSEYTNASESTFVKKANFASTENSVSITNGAFNEAEITDTSATTLLVPTSFTIENDNLSNYNGIININATQFASKSYEFVNPGSHYTNSTIGYNNVFVMANKEIGTQSITTSDIELTASSSENNYYKISFYVNTQNVVYSNIVAKLTTSDETLALVNIPNTNSSWKEVSIYVKTFTDTKTANLTIEFNEDKGYVFLDTFKLETLDAETFVTTTSSYSTSVELDKDNFSVGANASQTLNDAINYNKNLITVGANVESGIINAGNYNAIINTNSNSGNANQLLIHNETDAHYYLTSKQSYTLKSGNYYKVSVDIKTYNLYQETLEKDELGNEYKLGATFSLSGIDEKFTGIISDNYSTYTFYVSASSDKTITITFGLGDEHALTRGYAFFDNFVIEKIESTDFPTASEKTDNMILIGNTDEPEDDESDNSNETTTNFDWLVLPTLITSLALLLAIAGAIIRKINFKFPTRVKAVEYDRNKTLIKDFNKREQLRLREEKLNALRQRLEEIQAQIDENKRQFRNAKSFKEEIAKENTIIEQQVKETYSAPEINVEEKDNVVSITLDSKDTKITSKVKVKVKANKDSKKTIQDAKSKMVDKAIKDETKRLKLEARNKIKQEHRAAYLLRQEELKAQYLEIEKEIELILEEERILMEEYKEYRRQYKLKQKEAKLNKKNKDK